VHLCSCLSLRQGLNARRIRIVRGDPPQVPQDHSLAEPPSSVGVTVDSEAPTSPAALAVPAVPPSTPPATVCQPPAVHSVPPAGAGLAVPLSTIPTKRHGGSFRLSAGLGYWYTDFQHEPIAGSGASEASSFSGEGITTGIAIEGASSRNISVFGELLGSFIRDPSIKSPFGYSSAWDGTYALVSLGRGVAYYFDQLDIYASATLTMTRLFGKRTDAGAASAPTSPSEKSGGYRQAGGPASSADCRSPSTTTTTAAIRHRSYRRCASHPRGNEATRSARRKARP